ncbi:fasciclin domain-containing protein [Sphingosinicella xenopeptidilytica]|uniref:Fasciclin domain-containing protein n=1 Tax=Sphingosinicella xenopeptidilytica TaxID=364098 RepID=A0ABW3C0V6_SPHXN
MKTSTFLKAVAISALLATPVAAQVAEPPEAATAAPAAPAEAQVETAVAVDPTSVIGNVLATPELSTLAQAVKAAELVDDLSQPGPFTVFAPNNDAFARLGTTTVQQLMQPNAKAQLSGLVNYFVVPGRLTQADVVAAIEAGGGKAEVKTVQGSTLTATLDAGIVKLTDSQGNATYITKPDVQASNGVVHVVNGIVVPAQG